MKNSMTALFLLAFLGCYACSGERSPANQDEKIKNPTGTMQKQEEMSRYPAVQSDRDTRGAD